MCGVSVRLSHDKQTQHLVSSSDCSVAAAVMEEVSGTSQCCSRSPVIPAEFCASVVRLATKQLQAELEMFKTRKRRLQHQRDHMRSYLRQELQWPLLRAAACTASSVSDACNS